MCSLCVAFRSHVRPLSPTPLYHTIPSHSSTLPHLHKLTYKGTDSLMKAAKTSMSSKIIGGEMDFFARLAVDAALKVKLTNAAGKS